jgi:HPt (histidine-containing phosphotransfer) domain-containing protein
MSDASLSDDVQRVIAQEVARFFDQYTLLYRSRQDHADAFTRVAQIALEARTADQANASSADAMAQIAAELEARLRREAGQVCFEVHPETYPGAVSALLNEAADMIAALRLPCVERPQEEKEDLARGGTQEVETR